jgi:hypothetical protein
MEGPHGGATPHVLDTQTQTYTFIVCFPLELPLEQEMLGQSLLL